MLPSGSSNTKAPRFLPHATANTLKPISCIEDKVFSFKTALSKTHFGLGVFAAEDVDGSISLLSSPLPVTVDASVVVDMIDINSNSFFLLFEIFQNAN